MPRYCASRLRTGIALGFLVVLGSTVPSRSVTQAQSTNSVRQTGAPILIARSGEEDPGAPLEVGRADVHVTIAGFLARTTTTLTFENRTDRTLEGELIFPLPEGATISGYGLDVDGQIVDAVVVESQVARVTFEEEARRGIDPGLVEWVRGNSFRTRVWPIGPQGRRTIRVEYVSALARNADGGLVYQLPLRYSLPIPDATLLFEVLGPSAGPTLRTGRIANMTFDARDGRFVASARLAGEPLSDDVRIDIPALEHQAAIVETDRDGRAYFAIDDFVTLPAAPAAAKPRRVGLLWDASLSHALADAERELDVVKRWLAELGDVEVSISVFRNVTDPPRTLTIRGGDTTAVIESVRREPNDGGTSVKTLRPLPGVAYYLLVSDGFANIEPDLPPPMGAPIFTLTAAAYADHSLLRRLARTTGGQHIPLSTLTPAEAATRIGRRPSGTVTVEYDHAALSDVLPATPELVDGRVTVTGRLLASEAALTLRYLSASGAATERRFTLRQAGSTTSGLVPRFWAERKAAELSTAADLNRHEMVELGKRFGIVTPGTSLLVLETLDQYLRHGIEPPESRAELRAEYLELAAQREKVETRTREEKIDRVAAMWRDRIAWWKSAPSGPVRQKPPAQQSTPQSRARPARVLNCAGAPAAIQGRVTDAAGAEIPGATVTAINIATAMAVAVNTNAQGNFGLCNVPPGRYTIEVTLTGFRTWQGEAQLPATGALDVALELGTLSETVTVAASARTILSSTDGSPGSGMPAIAIKAWDPETPYLAAIKNAGDGEAYSTYLAQRERYATTPSFYLDCAEYFLARGQKKIGLRVLTSVLDLKLEDPRLVRVVAHRLQQLGELDSAIVLFEHVVRLRPEEPQSLRDLALALADRGDAARGAVGKPVAIAADYLRSIELLDQLVLGDWDDRFPEIETIALIDANRILAIMEREKLPGIERVTLDPQLRHSFDVDIRILLTWDTDQTDMDLWITEPTGEKCDYSHNRTAIGGAISRDFTGGYGPEEYLLRRAHAGKYVIQANFYGSTSQSLTGPTTAHATVITNFGRPNERRRTLTLRLSDDKEVVDIGSVLFEARGKQSLR